MPDGSGAGARPTPSARLVGLLRDEMPRGAFALALAAAVVLPLGSYCVIWGDLRTFVLAIDHCAAPLCDFVRHYDPMGRQVFAHHGPVPGFLYPPGFAVALGALGLLPPEGALGVWWAVQLLAVAALGWCGWVLLDRGRRPVFPVYVALLLTSYPVLHNLKWGQVSAPITVLVLLALIAARRPGGRAQGWAGLLLAAAVAVKLYPALFAPAVLGREGRKAAIGFAAGCALFLAVVPALALGPWETVDFYRVVFRRYSAAFVMDINAQSVSAVVERWLRAAADRSMVELLLPPVLHPLVAAVARHAGAARAVVEAGAAGVVALNLWLTASLWRRRVDGAAVWRFVLIAATLPFVVPTSWPHYFVHLPFCQAFVLHRLLRDGGSPRAVLAKAVLLVLPSAALSGVVAFHAAGSWLVFNFFGGVFWANLLLLFALYSALPRAAWRPPWRRVTDGGPPAAAPG